MNNKMRERLALKIQGKCFVVNKYNDLIFYYLYSGCVLGIFQDIASGKLPTLEIPNYILSNDPVDSNEG